ncbi:MAG: alpha-L-rhamnosidase [Actinomycetota bacterium]|nr:alpha-L-rhamnosidase [Actinomycetota bacterium]
MPGQRVPDWSGEWICRPLPTDAHDAHRPAAHLRTEFDVDGDVVDGWVHATAGGIYELWLNGQRIGDERFAPGWTDYRHRVRAQTHDVAGLLRPGANCIGAIVMDGWYAGYVGWDRLREHYGRTPVVKVELVVQLADGREVRVVSDTSWRTAAGPIRAGDLLDGERYDARYELGAWSEPGYDDSGWDLAWPDPGPSGAIVPTPCEPVRVVGEVPAVSVVPGRPGSRIVDLGEEVVGWPRLTVDAPAGTVVRLRCAEALDDAGELYTENLRAAACTDTFISRGVPAVWEPRSTYRGFRYVEITGAPDATVTGVVAHTDARPTGDFACSSADLTELWEMVRRTVRANLVSIPTDCPQRDERLGWMDVEVTMRTTSYLFDLGDFYAAWLADVRSGQSAQGAFGDIAPRLSHTLDAAAGWGDAGVAVPWGLWEWYGDRSVLEDNLDAMARWPQWIASQNPDGVWRNGRGNDYGDWLAVVESDKQVFATAWWARSCDLVARAASVLDRPDVAEPAAALGNRVRAAFAVEAASAPPTQTLLLLAREFGLAPWADRGDLLVADVEANGLTVGFQGVRHLLPALTALGRSDLAYALALREEQPGWLAMQRLGATTMWERWDSRTPDGGFANPFMNSLCHVALGTVASWLYATVGGLSRDPEAVGWRRALVAPEPGGGITWGRTSYDSRLGRYAVDWSLDGDVLEVRVEVPTGGEASVRLRGEPVSPVDGLRCTDGVTDGLLPPGDHRVVVRQAMTVGGAASGRM